MAEPRLSIWVGFLVQRLIQRAELKYMQNASNEARNPA